MTVLLRIAIATQFASATVVVAQDSAVSLVFRPGFVSDSALVHVVRELVKNSAQDKWETIRVNEGDNLSEIVYRHYRLGDTYRGVSGRFLQDTIATVNGLDSDRTLQVGQELKLPPIPKFPERPTSNIAGLQQVWDQGEMSVFRAAKTEPVTVNSNKSFDANAAAEWRITLNYAFGDVQYKNFQRELLKVSPSIFLDMREAVDQVLKVELDEPAALMGDTVWSSPIEPVANVEIHETHNITLFLLDFFQENCGHGAQVYQVAQEALKEIGLAQLISSNQIVRIDLDARYDQASKRRLFNRFLDTTKGWTSAQKNSWRRQFEQSLTDATGASDRVVSMLYYEAVMDSVRRTPGSRVVSSSFRVLSQGMGPFLSLDFPPTEFELYFSASGNDEKDAESLGDWSRRQPQNTYYSTSPRYPLFLVAGQKPSGARVGVWSRTTPWGVPFVGRAGRWGGSGCVSRDVYATSYASPAVAAVVFGALNVWHQAGLRVRDRDEIVRRLLSAADPVTPLLSYHAAPGPLNPAKLFLTTGTYVRTADSKSVSSPTRATGQISIRTNEGISDLSIGRSNASPSLWALQITGDSVSFLSSSTRYWRRGKIDTVNLTIPLTLPGCRNQINTGCEIKGPTDLRVMKELVVF
jgi:hypothetical protein